MIDDNEVFFASNTPKASFALQYSTSTHALENRIVKRGYFLKTVFELFDAYSGL